MLLKEFLQKYQDQRVSVYFGDGDNDAVSGRLLSFDADNILIKSTKGDIDILVSIENINYIHVNGASLKNDVKTY